MARQFTLLLLEEGFTDRRGLAPSEVLEDDPEGEGLDVLFIETLGRTPAESTGTVVTVPDCRWRPGVRELSEFFDVVKDDYPSKNPPWPGHPAYFAGSHAFEALANLLYEQMVQLFSGSPFTWDSNGTVVIIDERKARLLSEMEDALPTPDDLRMQTARKFIRWLRKAYEANSTADLLAVYGT